MRDARFYLWDPAKYLNTLEVHRRVFATRSFFYPILKSLRDETKR